MKQGIWLFVIFIVLILDGGALLAIKKVTALSLENMDRPRAVFFKVGEGKGQGVTFKDRKSYFSEMGEMGGRIQLRVTFAPLGYHLFSVLLDWHRMISG